MAKNRKTPKQQMKLWRVGREPSLLIRARTARVAVRKWMRGNRDWSVLYHEWEYYNPYQPQGRGEETPTAALKNSAHARAFARKFRIIDPNRVPVSPA